MEKDKIELINNYLSINDIPVYTNLDVSFIKNTIVIDKDIDLFDLNWYHELIKKCDSEPTTLIIKGINELSSVEQLKFGELLKYRKFGNYYLPKNASILVTYKDSSKLLCPELYSLFAHIKQEG